MTNVTTEDFGWPSMATAISLISLDQASSATIPFGTLVFTPSQLTDLLTFSTLWKLLLLLHIIANFKIFPFIYHLRILNAVRFVLRSQRPETDVRPEQLFQPLITTSKSCLMEIDVYGHKSNSTYFADVDIARAHLVTTLFGKGIEKIRGSTTMNGLSGKSSNFTMALGAVSCSFKRELRPYETYDMWTRILSWDEKWVYMVTHFVKKGAKITPREYTLYPKQTALGRRTRTCLTCSRVHDATTSPCAPDQAQKSPIAASALSKIVFKEGRKTIAPTTILMLSGLLPSQGTKSKGTDFAAPHPKVDEKGPSTLEALLTAEQVATTAFEAEKPGRNTAENTMAGWDWDTIEAERIRGLKMAHLLAKQTALEDEFRDDAALGSHYDGYGIEGVVLTLAQLGGLSRYQLL